MNCIRESSDSVHGLTNSLIKHNQVLLFKHVINIKRKQVVIYILGWQIIFSFLMVYHTMGFVLSWKCRMHFKAEKLLHLLTYCLMLCHFHFAICSQLCKIEMLLYYKNMSFVTLTNSDLMVKTAKVAFVMVFKISRGIHLMPRYDKIVIK
jgi:hypothetical protein